MRPHRHHIRLYLISRVDKKMHIFHFMQNLCLCKGASYWCSEMCECFFNRSVEQVSCQCPREEMSCVRLLIEDRSSHVTMMGKRPIGSFHDLQFLSPSGKFNIPLEGSIKQTKNTIICTTLIIFLKGISSRWYQNIQLRPLSS